MTDLYDLLSCFIVVVVRNLTCGRGEMVPVVVCGWAGLH